MMKSLKIEPFLQMNIGVLVLLGTLMLGMGQRSFFYPLFAFTAVALSFWLVDMRKVFALTPVWTGFFSVLVVWILLIEIVRNVEQSQLLNVANILVYLQAILLFQKKSNRVYWELIALSLLQIAVAAATNLVFVFGFMLVIYVMAAFLAMALFFVFREINLVTEQGSPVRPHARPASSHLRFGSFAWFPPNDASGFVVQSSFLGRIVSLALITVLGTILLFFAVPRYSNQVWQSPQSNQVATVGFTEEVELDTIGQILEDPEQVFRVEFQQLDRQPFGILDEVYFRGSVLPEFRVTKGTWRQQQFTDSKVAFNTVRARDLSAVIVQKITLQPDENHSVIFHAAPSFRSVGSHHPSFVFSPHNQQITLEKEWKPSKGAIRYEVLSSGFKDNKQVRWLPALDSALINRPPETTERYRNWRRENLISPWRSNGDENEYSTELRPVFNKASELIAEAGLENATSFEKIEALESYFLNSGEFTYSLKASKNRRRRINPIIDFLTNHKTGHCEYFASALALMVRSQGVPARLVVGYKGGDFNGVGGFFVVRRLHCHAWVEAFLGPHEIPADATKITNNWENGAWYRLDPTPIDTGTGEGYESEGILSTIKEFVGYCQVLWDDYVLGLNSDRQKRSIYEPLYHAGHSAVYFAFGRELWTERMAWIKRQGNSIITGRWLTWQTAVLMAILLPLLYSVRNRLFTVWKLACRFLWRQAIRGQKESGVVYYDRLERILGKRGYRRNPEQTQLDFVMQMETELNRLPQNVLTTSRRIVDAFYRVRFGHAVLSTDEMHELEASLSELESSLRS